MKNSFRAEALARPLRELRVELLKECPLRCVHCSAHAAPGNRLQLPPARVMTLLDEFAELGGQRVTFTGGEPLAYEHLAEVVATAAQLHLTTRLFSSGIVFANGQRVSAQERLGAVLPLIDTVVFSLYGVQAATHDAVTLWDGSFAATLAAIRSASEHGVQVGVHFVPTQENYREFPAFVAFTATLGIDFVSVLRFVAHGRGKASAMRLALNDAAHVWLRGAIHQAQRQHPQLPIKVGSAYNLLGIGSAHPCTAAIDQLVVEATGQISPCIAFVGHKVADPLGNIKHHSLRHIWEESIYLQQTRAALDETNRCGGCLAQKIMLSGRIDATVSDPLERLIPSTEDDHLFQEITQ